MKTFLAHVVIWVVFFSASAQAASDADVTLLKVKKVVIAESVITIVVEKAMTIITLIRDDHDPAYAGDTWHGMPVNRVQVLSNEATFTIKQDAHSAPGGPLAKAWQECLKTAQALQDGKEVGRIGFYAPDIVIKGNLITSITGSGFLYPKGK
ncbi:MAG: hypothetical protein CJBNEKGG_00932 [Prosthecobacter sp.]|nr:hypothetical protein [Prosthecobacter sp.]